MPRPWPSKLQAHRHRAEQAAPVDLERAERRDRRRCRSRRRAMTRLPLSSARSTSGRQFGQLAAMNSSTLVAVRRARQVVAARVLGECRQSTSMLKLVSIRA